MKTLQKNLDFLLEKYSVASKAVLKNEKTVVIDGKSCYPHQSRASTRNSRAGVLLFCGF